tara:strand:- start:411 stop:1004 length:594 start_codon:yes stop_codon:yes gene_type:complete
MDKMPKIEDPVVESFSEESDAELDEPLPSVPEIKEKEKVSQNEVFGDQMASKRNKDLDVKKVKKPKRQISEEQRERLRLGREKGLAKRKANAEAKRLAKDNSVASPVKEEEVKKEPEVKEVIKEKIIEKGITKEEVISLTSEASKKALEDYEILRKSRKQEKKKRLEEQNHRQQVRHKIETAVKGPSRDTTFDFCFA